MRSKLHRHLRRPSSERAAERKRAGAEAGGSNLAEADHRKPAEEEAGSNPVEAGRRSHPAVGSPAAGGILCRRQWAKQQDGRCCQSMSNTKQNLSYHQARVGRANQCFGKTFPSLTCLYESR